MTFVKRRWSGLHTVLAIFGIILGWMIVPIGFKGCTKDMLIEAQAPIWGALSDVKTFQDTAALKLQSKEELVKTIQELARTQAGLELKLKTVDSVESAKARLEQQLKMPPALGFETKNVRIINRDINSWWQQITVDAGRAQGVRSGMGVISREGVVGRVREVYDQASTVELITSPRFRMAVQLQGDERPFVYQGQGLRLGLSPVGQVQALQPEMALNPNQSRTVVTTGLSGSFPEGLPVGELIDTKNIGEGGLLEGRIRLNKSLLNLKEVTLLIPYR